MTAIPAVVRCAAALDDLDAAHATADQNARENAVMAVAVWWVVAEAQGATPADVLAHRTAA